MHDESAYTQLARKIQTRRAVVGVVGIGYIGLPTAVILSREGFHVIGFDVDSKKVDLLNKGTSYIDEPELPEITREVVEAGRLEGTVDFERASDCDVLIFCTQTPLNSAGIPNLDILYDAVSSTIPYSHQNLLVICESTVPPGTTQHIADMFTSTGRFEIDSSLWASHCPERVLPGSVIQEFYTNDRIVGGVSPHSTILARSVYESFLPREKIIETNATVSEFAKLSENIFRDVNIALANELAMAADKLNIDVTEAIALANRHPRVSIHSPGIGVGGHCLPKDPILLISAIAESETQLDIIRKAREINDHMPEYAVNRLAQVLENSDFTGQRVLVLGTTFKENVDDTRNSPSKALISSLLTRGAIVRAHDPKTHERFGAQDAEDFKSAIEWAKIVILAVSHSEYLNELPHEDLNGKIFFDGRNAFEPSDLSASIFLGIGRPTTSRDVS